MVRPIAFYLPQFHPIPENDAWWGKGFTEWTNTANAKPLFDGHYQPHVPADLGYYDLRTPEARAAQADLARRYGIEGFCYYHYWFGEGRRLLERPFDEVLASGEPDFPFCLCWANQSWAGHWFGADGRTLIEQVYGGEAEMAVHFAWLLQAFRDPRYIRVNGRPVMLVFSVAGLPDAPGLCRVWRGLAQAAGLPGLHLLAVRHSLGRRDPHAAGFDGAVDMSLPLTGHNRVELNQGVRTFDYGRWGDHDNPPAQPGVVQYPCVGPGWDNTPRLGRDGLVYVNYSPQMFRAKVRRAAGQLADRPPQDRLLFVKAWNEWAEGNHLEPDLRYGHAWLEALRDGVSDRS